MAESMEWLGENGVFAKRLTETIKEKGLTQKYVAHCVGAKEQTISQYAKGKVLPNAEMVFQIANCLQVSADYLLGLADIRSLDPNEKAMSEMLGLSEKAIKYLRRIMSYCYHNNIEISPYKALEATRRVEDTNLLPNEIVNILLEEDCDSDTLMFEDREEETVLSSIARVLSFSNIDDIESYYELKKIRAKFDGKDIERTETKMSVLQMSNREFLFARIAQLQQAVISLKNKLDKQGGANE